MPLEAEARVERLVRVMEPGKSESWKQRNKTDDKGE